MTTKPISGTGDAPNIGSLMFNARTSPAAEPPAGKAVIDMVNGRPGSRINGEARKPLAFNAEAQPLARWLVDDVAALGPLGSIGAIVTSADVGYVARVASPLGFYRLVSVGPAVWELVGTAPTTDASQLTTGTLPRARLPAPTTTELGGVKRNTGSVGQFLTGFDSSGNALYGTPTAGGGSHTRGAWADRPGSPAVGDSYLVTDLPFTTLRCWTAGTWTVYVCGVEVQPQSASYFGTWINQEAASIADEGPFFRMSGGAESFEWEARTRVRNLPASSNYTVEIGWIAAAYAGGCGISVYDASIGSTCGIVSGPTFPGGSPSAFNVNSSHRWAAYIESVALHFVQAGPRGLGSVVFARIRDEGTNRIYELSSDRITWVRIADHGRTSHVTPTQWGPSLYTAGASQAGNVLIVHAAESTP